MHCLPIQVGELGTPTCRDEDGARDMKVLHWRIYFVRLTHLLEPLACCLPIRDVATSAFKANTEKLKAKVGPDSQLPAAQLLSPIQRLSRGHAYLAIFCNGRRARHTIFDRESFQLRSHPRGIAVASLSVVADGVIIVAGIILGLLGRTMVRQHELALIVGVAATYMEIFQLRRRMLPPGRLGLSWCPRQVLVLCWPSYNHRKPSVTPDALRDLLRSRSHAFRFLWRGMGDLLRGRPSVEGSGSGDKAGTACGEILAAAFGQGRP